MDSPFSGVQGLEGLKGLQGIASPTALFAACIGDSPLARATGMDGNGGNGGNGGSGGSGSNSARRKGGGVFNFGGILNDDDDLAEQPVHEGKRSYANPSLDTIEYATPTATATNSHSQIYANGPNGQQNRTGAQEHENFFTFEKVEKLLNCVPLAVDPRSPKSRERDNAVEEATKRSNQTSASAPEATTPTLHLSNPALRRSTPTSNDGRGEAAPAPPTAPPTAPNPPDTPLSPVMQMRQALGQMFPTNETNNDQNVGAPPSPHTPSNNHGRNKQPMSLNQFLQAKTNVIMERHTSNGNSTHTQEHRSKETPDEFRMPSQDDTVRSPSYDSSRTPSYTSLRGHQMLQHRSMHAPPPQPQHPHHPPHPIHSQSSDHDGYSQNHPQLHPQLQDVPGGLWDTEEDGEDHGMDGMEGMEGSDRYDSREEEGDYPMEHRGGEGDGYDPPRDDRYASREEEEEDERFQDRDAQPKDPYELMRGPNMRVGHFVGHHEENRSGLPNDDRYDNEVRHQEMARMEQEDMDDVLMMRSGSDCGHGGSGYERRAMEVSDSRINVQFRAMEAVQRHGLQRELLHDAERKEGREQADAFDFDRGNEHDDTTESTPARNNLSNMLSPHSLASQDKYLFQNDQDDDSSEVDKDAEVGIDEDDEDDEDDSSSDNMFLNPIVEKPPEPATPRDRFEDEEEAQDDQRQDEYGQEERAYGEEVNGSHDRTEDVDNDLAHGDRDRENLDVNRHFDNLISSFELSLDHHVSKGKERMQVISAKRKQENDKANSRGSESKARMAWRQQRWNQGQKKGKVSTPREQHDDFADDASVESRSSHASHNSRASHASNASSASFFMEGTTMGRKLNRTTPLASPISTPKSPKSPKSPNTMGQINHRSRDFENNYLAVENEDAVEGMQQHQHQQSSVGRSVNESVIERARRAVSEAHETMVSNDNISGSAGNDCQEEGREDYEDNFQGEEVGEHGRSENPDKRESCHDFQGILVESGDSHEARSDRDGTEEAESWRQKIAMRRKRMLRNRLPHQVAGQDDEGDEIKETQGDSSNNGNSSNFMQEENISDFPDDEMMRSSKKKDMEFQEVDQAESVQMDEPNDDFSASIERSSSALSNESSVNWDALAYSMSDNFSLHEVENKDVEKVENVGMNNQNEHYVYDSNTFFPESNDHEPKQENAADSCPPMSQPPEKRNEEIIARSVSNQAQTAGVSCDVKERDGGNNIPTVNEKLLPSSTTPISSNAGGGILNKVNHLTIPGSPLSPLKVTSYSMLTTNTNVNESQNNPASGTENTEEVSSPTQISWGSQMKERIELIKRQHDEEIEKIRMARSQLTPRRASPEDALRIVSPQMIQTQSDEENFPFSPNSMTSSMGNTTKLTPKNGFQKTISNPTAPSHLSAQELAVQERINFMKEQHKKNMESMRHALESISKEKEVMTHSIDAHNAQTNQHVVNNDLQNIRTIPFHQVSIASAPESSIVTPMAGDDDLGNKEKHIAECVGLWKHNAAEFEKTKKMITSSRREWSTPLDNDITMAGPEVSNSKTQASSKHFKFDMSEQADLGKKSTEELIRMNKELEEEMKEIRMLSPKSAASSDEAWPSFLPKHLRINQSPGSNGHGAVSHQSASVPSTPLSVGSGAYSSSLREQISPRSSNLHDVLNTNQELEEQIRQFRSNTPKSETPRRESLTTMIANTRDQDRDVNSRISGLIRDVKDFLAENDRVREKLSEEIDSLNRDPSI